MTMFLLSGITQGTVQVVQASAGKCQGPGYFFMILVILVIGAIALFVQTILTVGNEYETGPLHLSQKTCHPNPALAKLFLEF